MEPEESLKEESPIKPANSEDNQTESNQKQAVEVQQITSDPVTVQKNADPAKCLIDTE